MPESQPATTSSIPNMLGSRYAADAGGGSVAAMMAAFDSGHVTFGLCFRVRRDPMYS
jgi:hypothetical protein